MDCIAAALAASPAKPQAALIGVEQEYYVSRGGEAVDFRELIHELAVDGLRIELTDANAYRLRSGYVFTADGTEAEMASPPLVTERGFATHLAQASAAGYLQLAAMLPPDLAAHGASTHLSVSMPEHLSERVCALYPRTYAAALMLLWDPKDGQGIFIRPRPGRIEFCGEALAGARLATVATFLVASLRVTVRALDRPGLAVTAMPPLLRVAPRPASERFGVEVRRDAFGVDLYSGGRAARLVLARGGTVSAGRQLQRSWAACRAAAAPLSSPNELQLLDRIVRGALPLPSEPGALGRVLGPPPEGLPFAWQATPVWPLISPSGLRIEAVHDSWDFTIFRLTRPAAESFASIPRPDLARFLALVSQGAFDHADLRSRRVLSRREQALQPGLFGRVGPRGYLVPPERDPGPLRFEAQGSPGLPPPTASATTSAARATAMETRTRVDARPAKWVAVSGVTSVATNGPILLPPAGRACLPWVIGVIFALVAGGLGIGAWALTGGGGDQAADGGPTPPGPQPGVAVETPTPVSSQAIPTSGSAPPTSTSAAPTATTASGVAVSPTASATSAAAPNPTATSGVAVTSTLVPTATTAAAPPATAAPTARPVVTAQMKFTQTVSKVEGACPPSVVPGVNLSPSTNTSVVIDWQNHTIKIGDSLVSPFDPVTRFAHVTWGTADQRFSDVTIQPGGLVGTSAFHPFPDIPAGASCIATLATSAAVVDGSNLIPPGL